MPDETITMAAMRDELKRHVLAAGGARKWCLKVGIPSHGSVAQAVSGTRDVSEAMANACGYIIETTFRKVEHV